MFRIERSSGVGKVRLKVIGRVTSKELPDLENILRVDRGSSLSIDLAEVTLVDREVVQFLATLESQNIGLQNCPAYIREWIVRECGPP
jgi:hypothetical protein